MRSWFNKRQNSVTVVTFILKSQSYEPRRNSEETVVTFLDINLLKPCGNYMPRLSQQYVTPYYVFMGFVWLSL
jgi:hypothetical protein